jgi:antibiotic biosynthesis monooxygenase (ABM) superfamily enzyme
MGVGRSLAYRKAWFRSAGGFESIAGRMSGDDDLLVNRAAESRTTGLLIPEATQVISMPETTWKAWFRQKVRHGSAGSAYKPTTLLILSGLHGVHLIFYLSLTVVLCLQTAMGWALLIYLCRAAAMGMILYSLPWKQKQGLPLASPLLDLAYLLYLVLLPVTAACIQPKWN